MIQQQVQNIVVFFDWFLNFYVVFVRNPICVRRIFPHRNRASAGKNKKYQKTLDKQFDL